MIKMLPIPVDDDSLGEAVLGLERQLKGMAENLEQYAPTLGLTAEGRLMYALAEDPYGPTHSMYPVGGYAKPLRPESVTARHRLQRLGGNSRRLHTRMMPYMVQSMPGPGGTSVLGQATPLGFMSSRGLDVCWDGGGWHVTAGKFRVGYHLPVMGEDTEIHIESQRFDGRTGMFFVRFGVEMLPVGGTRILSAKLMFHAGRGDFEIQRSSDFAIDGSRPVDGTYYISPGVVSSPLAYAIAPDGQRKAPVVLRMGSAVYPTDFSYALPTSLEESGVEAFDP